ncbi:hypothetical protein Hanom_Chr06g00557361 [Helianthus anomalus]
MMERREMEREAEKRESRERKILMRERQRREREPVVVMSDDDSSGSRRLGPAVDIKIRRSLKLSSEFTGSPVLFFRLLSVLMLKDDDYC